jgi:hypothetical protein
VYKISLGWVIVLIFYDLLLGVVSWPDAISQWIRRRVCNTFSENLRESAKETLGMMRQAFGKKMSHTRVLESKSLNSPKPKKATQVRSKVKSMFIISFGIERIVYRELVLTN